MSRFTAEDFAEANLATRGESGVARRAEPRLTHQWRAYGEGHGWFSDEEMAADGWTPAVESRITEHTLRDSQEKAARKRQKLVDHIADQDRVIRRRNEEITALRRELADAQAPLSLDSLAAAWEAAEVPTSPDFRDEDVVIVRNDSGIGGYFVRHAHDTLDLELWAEGAVRYLYRAPKREPWADLADVLGDFAIHDTDGREYPDVLARKLHERGVRVTGGDDDE